MKSGKSKRSRAKLSDCEGQIQVERLGYGMSGSEAERVKQTRKVSVEISLKRK